MACPEVTDIKIRDIKIVDTSVRIAHNAYTYGHQSLGALPWQKSWIRAWRGNVTSHMLLLRVITMPRTGIF